MRRSNCLVVAVILYRRRKRRWIARGKPAGKEPYFTIRGSRLLPDWVPHFAVWWRRIGGRVAMVSYKPMNTKKLPWWLVWKAILFKGKVARGD